MPGLLKIKEDYSWETSGIKFVLEERVGDPEKFIGRKKEMEFLYEWYQLIKAKDSNSIAFLGRRKIGKTLMMERLYNIVSSEHDGVIPFYYEFKEGEISAKEFAIDFISKFYLQVIGYYTREINLIRKAADRDNNFDLEKLIGKINKLDLEHKDLMLDKITGYIERLQENYSPYFYIKMATGAPDAFANKVGVKEKVLQIIDELQYFNSEVDAGREDIPSKCYMSTAESKVAPLLVTGSFMGVLTHDLMKYTPQRFNIINISKMEDEESKVMIKNYGERYGHSLTEESIDYIAKMTNNVPGRIINLLEPNPFKDKIKTVDDVDKDLYYEVSEGQIRRDWEEYLSLAMDRYNDKNMKFITYYLCQNEGEYYFPGKLKDKLGIDIEYKQLRKELDILNKYDLIERKGGEYGGVFDRTLKHVLMVNDAEILNLPTDELVEYFKTQNQLTYLKATIKELEISTEKKGKLEEKVKELQGSLNYEKGKRFELLVLTDLLRKIIAGNKGIVDGIKATDLDFYISYCLKTGEDIDVLIESSNIIIAVECKNYKEENINKINQELIDKYIENLKKLAQDYPGKEIRPLYISKKGFTDKSEKYLKEKGIPTKI